MRTGPIPAPMEEVPGDFYMKRLLNGPVPADAAPGRGSEPEESP